MDEFENFLDEYDDLTERLVSSRHQDFPALAKRLLRLLGDGPETVQQQITYLRAKLPIEEVENSVLSEPRGMVGSGRMAWPEDVDATIGGQLNLLERLSETPNGSFQFAHDYFPTRSNNLNDILHQMMDHMYEPTFRDLRRHLVRAARKAPAAPVLPASDRVVTLDHNSIAHDEADAALADVVLKVEQSNVGDPEEKGRVVAEVNAARGLLKAAKVRITALATLVVGALGWVANQFAETAAGQAADWAIQKLIEYLPALSGLF